MADVELTSELSRAQLLAVYKDCADYDLVDSVERARRFIQAGRMLLATPVVRTSSQIRGEEVELDPTIVERQVTQAAAWCKGRAAACEPVRSYAIDEGWRD